MRSWELLKELNRGIYQRWSNAGGVVRVLQAFSELFSVLSVALFFFVSFASRSLWIACTFSIEYYVFLCHTSRLQLNQKADGEGLKFVSG